MNKIWMRWAVVGLFSCQSAYGVQERNDEGHRGRPRILATVEIMKMHINVCEVPGRSSQEVLEEFHERLGGNGRWTYYISMDENPQKQEAFPINPFMCQNKLPLPEPVLLSWATRRLAVPGWKEQALIKDDKPLEKVLIPAQFSHLLQPPQVNFFPLPLVWKVVNTLSLPKVTSVAEPIQTMKTKILQMLTPVEKEEEDDMFKKTTAPRAMKKNLETEDGWLEVAATTALGGLLIGFFLWRAQSLALIKALGLWKWLGRV